MGRPSTYSEEVAEEICWRIRCGESLKQIVRDDDMPDERTVYRWLDDERHEAFRQQYARAREGMADADADAVNDIGRRVLSGEIDPQAARVAMDALKWSAGKRNAKKYGDKVQTELSGGVELTHREARDLTDDELAAVIAKHGG